MSEPAESCRSCHAPVVWARHAQTDKVAPIDAAPTDDGNILIEADGRYRLIGKGARAEYVGRLHTNHFVTCPQRQKWGSRA